VSRRSLTVLVLFLVLCGSSLFAPGTGPGDPDRPDRPPVISPAAIAPPAIDEPGPVADPPTVASPDVPSEMGTLVGTVLTVDGRPIDGACVHASWRFEARAGEGKYRFEGMPPGTWRVGAAAPGHPPVQHEVRIEAGVETRLDFVLVPGGLPVAGTVTDADGRPLAGAKITVTPKIDGGRAFSCIEHPLTGPDGRFRIEGVPEGAAWVNADAPVCQAKACKTTAGTTGIVIALEAAGEIHGTIVLPPGVPSAPRYRVQLLTLEGTEEVELHSDLNLEECDGLTFVLRGLMPGTYRLEAFVPGVGRADVADVRVEVGKVARVKLEIAAGQVLTGRVVAAADGAPVSDALVVVAAQGEWGASILMMILEEESAWVNAAVTARTDAKGRYRIAGLIPGTCNMAAVAPGFRPVALHGVELPRRGDVPDFVLPAAGGLVVRLIDGAGRPESNVSVIVEFDQETGSFDADTDARGECRFDCVPPGRRVIQVDTTPTRTIGFEVDVTAGRVTKVEVRMPAPGTFLSGVVHRSGKPVANHRVEARFKDAAGREFELATQTDGEGRYRLDHLLPGPVWVAASRRWSSAPGALERVNVVRGQNIRDIDLDVDRPSVVVVDATSGGAIPTARILLAESFWAGADEEGRIVLPGAAAARSAAVVFADGYGPVRLLPATGTGNEARRIEMRKSARLTLSLLDSRGRPVPSAVVAIRETGAFDIAPFVRDWQDDWGDSQRGRYVYDLAPGSYRVRITHPEHATVERKLMLPTEGARVEIVMP